MFTWRELNWTDVDKTVIAKAELFALAIAFLRRKTDAACNRHCIQPTRHATDNTSSYQRYQFTQCWSFTVFPTTVN